MAINWIFIDEDGTKHATNAQGTFDDPEVEEMRQTSLTAMRADGISEDADAECYVLRNPPPQIEIALQALSALQELRALTKDAQRRNAAQFN